MTEAESGGGGGGTSAVVWLRDAGLDYLISRGASNQENSERSAMVMFGSLTRRQSIAVQKRLREVGTVAAVSEHQLQFQQRRRGNGKVRGNSITSESPLAGRLVSSFSGPLDTPTPQKTCVAVTIGSNILNAGKRSGSYDLGKLSLTETPGVVLKARRHVEIMEAYDACNPSDASCVYREEVEKRVRSASNASTVATVYEGFPTFLLTACDVGITLACHDLSAADLVVVRRLAFIESSAVFDELNIRTTSLNQTNSTSTNSLMGLLSGKHASKVTTAPSTSTLPSLPSSSLESLLNKSRSRTSPQTRVPILIERILAELCSPRCANTEGLFRVPPSQQRLRNLLKDIQSSDFNEVTFDFSEVPPPDLAALLKHIVRALSPSLFTPHLETRFVLAVSDIPNQSDANTSQPTAAPTQPAVSLVPPSSVIRERLRLLNLLVLQLPDVNRDTLQLILSALRLLAGPASNNRMTASSLAVVLAPLFFPSMQAQTDADHIHRQVFVVQLLIIYADVLFVVPNQLLDQVRLHNTLLNQRNFVSGPKHTRKVAASWWRFWSRERVAARKLLSPATGSPVTSDQQVISVITPSLFTLATPKGSKTVAGSGGANSGMTTTVQLRLRPDMKASEGADLTVKNILAVTPSVKAAALPGHDWFLFEIGGNIRERCLDPNSLLLSIYRRNPTAIWELRLLANNRTLLPIPSDKIRAEAIS